ncbi:hypothetical protein CWB73_01430 [Pseudoalteromonas phenolica]|uniref:Teneurin-like YD-shell domain-containing protein n=2 Tax=Pseudoalteromonas phenolica TaxID=161398 RepID=A0A5S3YXW6_9GAMM|nr:hypothetical protein CWB73_01430 [Pseudoalteromonas phenolica]
MKYIFIAIILSFKTYAVDYKYDNAKRITEAAYKDGTVVSYTYDKNGNLLSVSPTESSTDDGDDSDGSSDNESPDTDGAKEKGSDGGNCFIATAAYGSYFMPKVKTLRAFRDEYLLTNTIGRSLVEIYYKNSPPIASYISKREWLKLMVRSVLTPVAYFIENPYQLLVSFMMFLAFVFRRKLSRNRTFG